MNPFWKNKWISALRSGKYKKEVGELKCGDNFCVLGVLGDIMVQDQESGLKWVDEDLAGGGEQLSGSLPTCAGEAAGLTDADQSASSEPGS